MDRIPEQGFAGPLPVLTKDQCRQLKQGISKTTNAPPMDWDKGYAASSRAYYEIGTAPAIIDVVTSFLGDDVILWGASVQTRRSGQVHAWHSDIESAGSSSRTVAVWMGIENTSIDSSLMIVPYSHRFGVTIQEVRHQKNANRLETSDDDILQWAREFDARASLERFEMTDGEALFFDGKLWHSSRNLLGVTRHALLLQYATPETPIRIPNLNQLDWPIEVLESPQPPCLILRGSDEARVNRIVPAPVAANSSSVSPLKSLVFPLRIPLKPDEKRGWKPYPIFSGPTADVPSLSCHASALTHGSCPHSPHKHKEEELLLLLQGEVELELPELEGSEQGSLRRLQPGEFVYYPADFPHTLTTASDEPANYLMFKWHGSPTDVDEPLRFGQFRAFESSGSGAADGFRIRRVFEGPTANLRKLHCHSSTLTPGAGYEPHIDAYDVALIVLEGEVETLDQRVGPFGVIFYRAGEPHGISNPGEMLARYLVFEFHGNQSASGAAFQSAPSLIARLASPRRWFGRLKYEAWRVKQRLSR